MKLALMTVLLLSLAAYGSLDAAEKDKAKGDPLSKFSDEDLVDPAFCFNQFAAALKNKEVAVARAFLHEVPKALAALDLKKEADQATFLKGLSKYAGATAVASQKMGFTGVAEVTFSDASGAEKTVRMQNINARWLILPD